MPRTILVVEESDRARELLSFVLEFEGYRVLAVPSAEAARRLLEQHPEIDLLFADISGPEAPALVELADDARARHPDLKMLFTTGLSGSVQAAGKEGLTGGRSGEPSPVARMLAMIKETLDRA